MLIEHGSDPRDDSRWPDRDTQERDVDPREVFTRDHAVALTKEGRGVLESHRDRDREGGQSFYAGVKRERELEHDVL